MTETSLLPAPGDAGDAGEAMHAHVRELYPWCRSITGDGVRDTLRSVSQRLSLVIHEVASGTPVLDWTVPDEWNVADAFIADRDGRRVVDFADSNLHVVSYSRPVDRLVSRAELEAHLHSLPDQPDLIPYRTAYHRDDWGFCVSERQRRALTDDAYRVCVDSTLAPGSLTYGEAVLPGRSSAEVVLSTHVCHPSLANDNLAGIALLTSLGRHLAERDRRFTYRLLFIPVTIGSITWLARNPEAAQRTHAGLVVAGGGDDGPLTYKRSRRGDTPVDRAAAAVLATADEPHEIVDFSPYGYDERQFCSPGFDLPVGCFSRARHGAYPEYHTSADTPGFVRPASLAASLAALVRIVDVLEQDRTCRNLQPFGEPQLGRRGLYHGVGGHRDQDRLQLAMLWVLNQSDGHHSLLDIAQRAGLPFALIAAAAEALEQAGLLDDAEPAHERG